MSLPIDHPYKGGAPLDLSQSGGRLYIDQRPLWTPAEIATDAWYDASDTSTITIVGSGVDTLADKSVNGYDLRQLSDASRPLTGTRILNGLNVLDLNGSQYIRNVTDTAITGNPGVLIASVRQYDALTSTHTSVAIGDRAGGNTVIMGAETSNLYSCYFYNGNQKFSSANIDVPEIQIYTRPASGTHADGEMWVNGSSMTEDSVSQGTNVINLNNDICIGADTSGGATMDGFVGEVIIIDDPSTDTRQKLEGYLAHKWGLTANLPVDHPYKSEAPTA